MKLIFGLPQWFWEPTARPICEPEPTCSRCGERHESKNRDAYCPKCRHDYNVRTWRKYKRPKRA